MNAPWLYLVFLSFLATAPAFATPVEFDFTVDITSGALVGERFSGNFSYDEADVVGTADEFADLSSFMFSFQGFDFGLNDSIAPEAAFFDGEFLGLSYSVDLSAPVFFSFVPGFFSVDDAFFAYEDPNGDGDGTIAFSRAAQVSAPISLFLLASGLIGMLGLRKKT